MPGSAAKNGCRAPIVPSNKSGWPTVPGTGPLKCPAGSVNGLQSRVRWSQQPSILLADEPTGNLDSATGADIMSLFDQLQKAGQTIILVTHEASVAAHADREVHILDGTIASDTGAVVH